VTATRDALKSDNYADRIGKILPAELTATYLPLRVLAETMSVSAYYLFSLALILAAFFFFLAPHLIKLATLRNRTLYCLTFLVWVVAIDTERLVLEVFQAPVGNVSNLMFLVSGLGAVWSFAVPYMMEERS
jgi:hypothetical protein|tara:strand:+ start:4314 stop:4706 length:393 start_codon:yes stop_codon:yes gene_type:complete